MSISLSDPWPYPLVEVKWLDAETAHGWENAKDVEPSDELVTTVGFLIKKTKTSYMLGASICYQKDAEDHAFNARVQIPKSMVKKLTVLVPKNTKPAEDPKNDVRPTTNASVPSSADRGDSGNGGSGS